MVVSGSVFNESVRWLIKAPFSIEADFSYF